MSEFQVTPKDNFVNGKLKDRDAIGTCIKTETIVFPKVDSETNEVKSEFKVVCHVIWSGLAPFHPAVKLHDPLELVLLGEIDTLSNLMDRLEETEARLDDIEEAIFDEEDEETQNSASPELDL